MEEMVVMIVLCLKMLIGIMNQCTLKLQREKRIKEAMVDMKFHDTSSSAINEEVLTVDRRNGGDD
jgi:hypothetical protein